MKTILSTNILLLFFAVNTFSQEQKVTVKKNLVSVDGTAVFTLISTNYPDAYTLYNPNKVKRGESKTIYEHGEKEFNKFKKAIDDKIKQYS